MLSIGIAAGVLIGATIADGGSTGADVNKSVQKFREVLMHIDKNYVDEVDTEELVEDAITHMLSNLDPHSSYIPDRKSVV